jgi:hypothetical protein
MEATKTEWNRRGYKLKKEAKPTNGYHGRWGWFNLYDENCVEPKKPRTGKQRENDAKLGRYAKLEAEKYRIFSEDRHYEWHLRHGEHNHDMQQWAAELARAEEEKNEEWDKLTEEQQRVWGRRVSEGRMEVPLESTSS